MARVSAGDGDIVKVKTATIEKRDGEPRAARHCMERHDFFWHRRKWQKLWINFQLSMRAASVICSARVIFLSSINASVLRNRLIWASWSLCHHWLDCWFEIPLPFTRKLWKIFQNVWLLQVVALRGRDSVGCSVQEQNLLNGKLNVNIYLSELFSQNQLRVQ